MEIKNFKPKIWSTQILMSITGQTEEEIKERQEKEKLRVKTEQDLYPYGVNYGKYRR